MRRVMRRMGKRRKEGEDDEVMERMGRIDGRRE